MTVEKNYEGRGNAMVIDITGHAALAVGGVANPEGVELCITKATLQVITPSTGAANINIGVGATIATDANDIIAALAMGGAITGKWYNGHARINAAKTEITAPLWGATQYVTFTGSATTAGLVARLYLEYIRL